MNSFFSAHTIIYPLEKDLFLLYQLLTRKGVVLNTASLALVNTHISGETIDKGNISVKDLSTFSLSECLLDNPNGLLNRLLLDTELNTVGFQEGIQLLEKHSILVHSDAYTGQLGKKTSLFDKGHTGNFHQQIGEYVLHNKNINAEMWWITQKFSADYTATTDTPYKWVQETFMHTFFTNENMKNQKVLDFGCGIGYYSNFFSKLGGKVTAVDPSEVYINIAKNMFSKNGEIDFRKEKFESESDFNVFDAKYDMIFLSDVFLYYFEPYKKMELTPAILLKKLANLLNENGRIYIMDPHGIFHLQPWMNKNAPFVMAMEYANRKYRVTPSLEEVSLVSEEAGLAITRIRELKYTGEDADKKFYAEFPFWWFFELVKKSGKYTV